MKPIIIGKTLKMATDNGSIKTSDPRYREGFKIVMPQQSKAPSESSLTSSESSTLKTKESKDSLTDEESNSLRKTVEYLEQQRKEHMKDGSM